LVRLDSNRLLATCLNRHFLLSIKEDRIIVDSTAVIPENYFKGVQRGTSEILGVYKNLVFGFAKNKRKPLENPLFFVADRSTNLEINPEDAGVYKQSYYHDKRKITAHDDFDKNFILNNDNLYFVGLKSNRVFKYSVQKKSVTSFMLPTGPDITNSMFFIDPFTDLGYIVKRMTNGEHEIYLYSEADQTMKFIKKIANKPIAIVQNAVMISEPYKEGKKDFICNYLIPFSESNLKTIYLNEKN